MHLKDFAACGLHPRYLAHALRSYWLASTFQQQRPFLCPLAPPASPHLPHPNHIHITTYPSPSTSTPPSTSHRQHLTPMHTIRSSHFASNGSPHSCPTFSSPVRSCCSSGSLLRLCSPPILRHMGVFRACTLLQPPQYFSQFHSLLTQTAPQPTVHILSLSMLCHTRHCSTVTNTLQNTSVKYYLCHSVALSMSHVTLCHSLSLSCHSVPVRLRRISMFISAVHSFAVVCVQSLACTL